MAYFGPFPKTTNAYAQDSSGNEYFGEAANGADVNRARWTIFQKQNTGGASNPTAWIILFPIDTTIGVGSNEAKFIWAQATTGTYTYVALGMNA